MIRIIDFTEDRKEYIRKLNIEWLEKYFYVEPSDMVQLSDPLNEIINKGGRIFYAEWEGEIVSTASLLRIDATTFELGKMATTAKAQGNGIGSRVLEHSINEARKMGAKRLILYSNKKLASALHLYQKFGFTEIPLGNSSYKRSDIKMEKLL
jgi:GNAT superfamily N-acetyltransferase